MTINSPVVWPRPLPATRSWWICDRTTFNARLKDEAKRMDGSQGEKFVTHLQVGRHLSWGAASPTGSVKGGSHD